MRFFGSRWLVVVRDFDPNDCLVSGGGEGRLLDVYVAA